MSTEIDNSVVKPVCLAGLSIDHFGPFWRKTGSLELAAKDETESWLVDSTWEILGPLNVKSGRFLGFRQNRARKALILNH